MAVTKQHGVTIEDSSDAAIAGVTSLGEISFEAGDIGTTDYDVADNFKTYIAGLGDAGELEVGLKYDKDEMTTWYAKFGGSNETWTITIPDGDTTDSTLVFDGYVKSLGVSFPDAEDDDYIRQSLTLKISGKPTFTASS